MRETVDRHGGPVVTNDEAFYSSRRLWECRSCGQVVGSTHLGNCGLIAEGKRKVLIMEKGYHFVPNADPLDGAALMASGESMMGKVVAGVPWSELEELGTLDGAMRDAADWGASTFPEVSDIFVAGRIRDEGAELAEAPRDRYELADVLILAAILARKQGVNMVASVRQKMAINRERAWNTQTMKHIKSETEIRAALTGPDPADAWDPSRLRETAVPPREAATLPPSERHYRSWNDQQLQYIRGSIWWARNRGATPPQMAQTIQKLADALGTTPAEIKRVGDDPEDKAALADAAGMPWPEALGWAAQAWCTLPTEDTVMDPILAEAFAVILLKRLGEDRRVVRIQAARRELRDLLRHEDGHWEIGYEANVAVRLYSRIHQDPAGLAVLETEEGRNKIARNLLDLILGAGAEG